MGRKPRVILPSGAQHYAMAGERIVEVSSDGGGCLISMRVIDGRLRIEVYRADDTVDVIAPAPATPSRDVSHLGRPREATDRRAMNGL